MSDKAKQARPHRELIAEFLDSRVPKSEREWAAKREIEKLRAEIAKYNHVSEQLAIRILGQEKYDNSPCQAHPLELIAVHLDERCNCATLTPPATCDTCTPLCDQGHRDCVSVHGAPCERP